MRSWSLLCLACGCDRVFLSERPAEKPIDAAIVIDGPPGDGDNDTITDDIDNCPQIGNKDQHDEDRDTVGDACDNCPHVANVDQRNDDSDGLGNVCDDAGFACIAHFDPLTKLPDLTGSKGAWGLANEGESVAQTSEASNDALLFLDANIYDNPLLITAGKVTMLGISTDYNTAALWGEASTAQTIAGTPNNSFVAEMTRSATTPIDNQRPGVHTGLRTNGGTPSNGMFAPFMPSQGSLAEGAAFEIRLDMRLGTTIHAAVRMNGGAQATTTTGIANLAANRVALRTNRMAATFDYVLVVETGTPPCPARR